MEIPRHWRLKAQRYRLVGSLCPTCSQVSFPPRQVCPHCTAQPAQDITQGLILPVRKQSFAWQVGLKILQKHDSVLPVQ